MSGYMPAQADGKTWQYSCRLRWAVRGDQRVLQIARVCKETGEVAWDAVPEVQFPIEGFNPEK